MQFERLVIEAGTNTFTLELHPRLTVLAGVGKAERDSIVGELIGALGSTRSGVHAELVTDDGRHLAVFRPEGARHRVVDIEAAKDVSGEFTTPDGRIDLLHHHGVELRQARRKMRFTASDLSTGSKGAALIRRLADADQARLWTAAEALQHTDEELQRVSEEVGSAPEDAEVVDRIEQRHMQLEAAQDRQERHRRTTFLASLIATVLAIPALVVSTSLAFPLLGIAAIAVAASVFFRAGVKRAAKAEDEALAAAGAQSYLGFQIQRVNGLLSSDAHRKALMQAAQANREAVAAWRELAGEISADWALEHREEIIATARVRRDVQTLSALSSAPLPDDDATSDLARVLVTHLAELRHLGIGGEGFPLVLDDPLVELDPRAKPALLELLGQTAGSPQLVFLTEDDDVASWARLEALTGALSIIEPQPEHVEPPAPSRRRERDREVIRLS